jgi:hypothetical protein
MNNKPPREVMCEECFGAGPMFIYFCLECIGTQRAPIPLEDVL